MESKRDTIHHVKYWQITLAILMFAASLALAEDFKTVAGKEFKDATVTRVEPDGILIRSKSGISKVYFTELPKEVQKRFRYDAAQAAQFNAITQNVISENNAAIANQQAQAAKAEMERRERAVEQQRQSEQRQAQMERQDRTAELQNQVRNLKKQMATQQAQAAKASKRKRHWSDGDWQTRESMLRSQHQNDMNHMREQYEIQNAYGR